jgi:DNA repair protein RecO (recombination protein O)
MILATKGIVLNYIKYKETSIIVKIFTEKFGLKSFIVNGIRSQKAKKSIGNYQPFTILDMQIYWHEQKDLLRISESKIWRPTPDIAQNIKKSTIAIFLSEVLLKTLYHETNENPTLYQFIEQSVLRIDQTQSGYEDFHVRFLIALCPYLGFALDSTDLITSVEMDPPTEHYLAQLMASPNLLTQTSMTSGEVRKKGLEAVIAFMYEHMDTLSEIKSLKVLHQVFH